jgi:hypothetical protein
MEASMASSKDPLSDEDLRKAGWQIIDPDDIEHFLPKPALELINNRVRCRNCGYRVGREFFSRYVMRNGLVMMKAKGCPNCPCTDVTITDKRFFTAQPFQP